MKIYYLSLENAKKLNIAACQKLFPKRYALSKKYVKEEDALRSLAAGALIHSILGVSEEEIRYTENAKPYLSGIHFNLSHSGDYIVLCTHEKEVGIDIELIDKSNLFVASKVYTKDEIEWMKEDELNRFHTLWTIKESILKAIGSGMTIDPITFSVADILKNGSGKILGETWFCKTVNLVNHSLSVCSKEEIPKLELVDFYSSNSNSFIFDN